jgi:hypothetical protein
MNSSTCTELSTFAEDVLAGLGSTPAMLLSGIFTPTEAGSVGTFAVLALALGQKSLHLKGFFKSVDESLRTACMVLMLLAGSTVLGHFLAVTRIPMIAADWVTSLPLHRYAIMGLISLIYLIGRRYGHLVSRVPLLKHHLSPERLARAQASFHSHGGKTLFVARFLPGLRAPQAAPREPQVKPVPQERRARWEPPTSSSSPATKTSSCCSTWSATSREARGSWPAATSCGAPRGTRTRHGSSLPPRPTRRSPPPR